MHLMWFPVMGELRVRDWRATGRMSDVHALHALHALPLTTADAQAVMFQVMATTYCKWLMAAMPTGACWEDYTYTWEDMLRASPCSADVIMLENHELLPVGLGVYNVKMCITNACAHDEVLTVVRVLDRERLERMDWHDTFLYGCMKAHHGVIGFLREPHLHDYDCGNWVHVQCPAMESNMLARDYSATECSFADCMCPGTACDRCMRILHRGGSPCWFWLCIVPSCRLNTEHVRADAVFAYVQTNDMLVKFGRGPFWGTPAPDVLVLVSYTWQTQSLETLTQQQGVLRYFSPSLKWCWLQSCYRANFA